MRARKLAMCTPFRSLWLSYCVENLSIEIDRKDRITHLLKAPQSVWVPNKTRELFPLVDRAA